MVRVPVPKHLSLHGKEQRTASNSHLNLGLLVCREQVIMLSTSEVVGRLE